MQHDRERAQCGNSGGFSIRAIDRIQFNVLHLKAEFAYALAMDNTGNPFPQLSSLTLQLSSEGGKTACHVRLSIGQSEVVLEDGRELRIGLKTATLSLTHPGFDLIEQTYIRSHVPPNSDTPQAHKTVKTAMELEGKVSVNPKAQAKFSREETTSGPTPSKMRTASVVGKSGPIWRLSPSKGDAVLDGEFIPFDPPVAILASAPGVNFQEVRGSVHLRQKDMQIKPHGLQNPLSRNAEAVLQILLAKGVSRVCQPDGTFRGELILSNQAAIAVKAKGK